MKNLGVVSVSAEILTKQHLNASRKGCGLNKIVWALCDCCFELVGHIFLSLIGYQLVV
jgi:hypothetical protein